MNTRFPLAVFSKPWTMPLPELGAHLSALGCDGLELPVRPGFQVTPETVEELPVAARVLGDFGLRLFSIAGPTDEPTLAACAEAGAPIIRICPDIPGGRYLEAEAEWLRRIEELLPLLERYGVTLGLQNHCDLFVPNALGLRRLVEGFDPRYVGAVWDPAHCALDGEVPEMACDVLESHLCMVNLKNALWQRVNGPEAPYAQWRSYWTSGRQGLASWPRVAELLRERGWSGTICLTAEYSDHDALERLIAEDLAFARSLFTEE